MDPFARSPESQAEADAYTARVEAAGKAVREHPGWMAKDEWDSLGRSHAIWVRNLAELQGLLNLPEQNDDIAVSLMSNIGAQHEAEEFFGALDQRLHNMISAAVSLVDHARILVNGYEGTPFAAGFTARNDVVWNEPRTRFLRGLRNFLLHVGHAPLVTRMDVKNDVVTTKILLESKGLLSAYTWDAPARKFIKANPDGVHLSAEVMVYAADIENLYRWTFAQYEVLHGADIEELNKLIGERNLALSNGAFASKAEFEARILQSWAKENPTSETAPSWLGT